MVVSQGITTLLTMLLLLKKRQEGTLYLPKFAQIGTEVRTTVILSYI